MKNFNPMLFLWLLSLTGCSNSKNGKEQTQFQLKQRNYVADHTIDDELDALVPGLNCIAAKGESKRYFVLEKDYVQSDTNQILIVTFRLTVGKVTPSGFSDLANRIVFICPPQISSFVQVNSLSSTSDLSGYLGIVLLHELGHFITGISGNFDEANNEPSKKSRLGEQDMNTTPQYLTYAKKRELQVDSLAVQMLKKSLVNPTTACLLSATGIQLAINGAEFMQFGNRILGNFGTLTPSMIKDQAWSHPNIELRLAFMNFHIHPTLEKKQQIDEYLYEREIAPVIRQSTDPRIFQGDQKNLPIDQKK